MKPFTHALALGLNRRVPTEGSCKRLFYCPNCIRTPHESSESAWTAWKRTPHSDTPAEQNAISVGLATGEAHGNSGGQARLCV